MAGKHLVLGRRNQVTLPREYIPEGVGFFVCEKREDGSILLVPQVSVPYGQAYFWSRRWQEGEKAASKDIQEGRLRRHESADGLIKDIEDKRKS